jgi:hypothetical protein
MALRVAKTLRGTEWAREAELAKRRGSSIAQMAYPLSHPNMDLAM